MTISHNSKLCAVAIFGVNMWTWFNAFDPDFSEPYLKKKKNIYIVIMILLPERHLLI